MPEEALILHEASKCLPVMWDKAEVGGPPYPQVTDAQGSLLSPHKTLRQIDELKLHPICGRMSLALISHPTAFAPYPNPDQWLSGVTTGYDAFVKGNPMWLAKHVTSYCFNPDTSVCTSFTVCWAMVTRHVTKFIHRYCDESLRKFPEAPISE